jgi:soluble lytic murein transglycosylase-like protein
MNAITNYPGSRSLRSLGNIPQILANRIALAENSRFQKILSAFEGQSHKTRGLTIADYRARAVIAKSRYRPQPQSPDPELKNTVSKNSFRANFNRFEAHPTKQKALTPLQSPGQKIEKRAPVEKLQRKTGSRSTALSDRQIIEQNIQRAAAKYNLPPELIKAVVRAESNFEVNAVSTAGAQGLMQLMPATAKELGVENPFDIAQNIDGGTKYLRKMLDRFGGSVRKALAAYNAGPGTVMKYNGRVPYAETRQYVRRVLRFSGQIA